MSDLVPAPCHLFLSARHIALGDALREHIETAVNALPARYFNRPYEVRITIGRGRRIGFTCHVQVHVGRAMLYEASAEETNAYRCFEKALDRVAKQLRRDKRARRDDKPVNMSKATIFAWHNQRVEPDQTQDNLPMTPDLEREMATRFAPRIAAE